MPWGQQICNLGAIITTSDICFVNVRSFSPASGSCPLEDALDRLDVVLTFNGDFNQLKATGKLTEFVRAVEAKLTSMGVKGAIVGQAYAGSVKVNVSVEQGSQDLAVVQAALEQGVARGDLDVNVGGATLALLPAQSVVTARTASQTAVAPHTSTASPGGPQTEETNEGGGGGIDVAVIGGVVGALVLLLVVVVVVCVWHRKKGNKSSGGGNPGDDTYDHIRAADTKSNMYDNPPVYNQAFEPDHIYDKIKT